MARLCEGRVAIVTGAGRGLGREHSLLLAAQGAKVMVNDIGANVDGTGKDASFAAQTVADIKKAGGEAMVNGDDVSSWSGAKHMIDEALAAWGRLDIVVNNAGFGRPRMVFNLSDDEWDDVIRVHLRGTFVVSRPACRHWRAEGKAHGSTYGRLINTATGLLVYGGAGQSNYVAAKAGINAFTEAVATEMAPYGVTANAIMPGANTRLAQIGWRTERMIAADGGTQQARDLRDPVHVAELGCFLASPEAAGISGQTFQVHGGTIEQVQTWKVARTWQRDDRGFTAHELARELPLDAGPKPADRPPPEWTAARKA